MDAEGCFIGAIKANLSDVDLEWDGYLRRRGYRWITLSRRREYLWIT